MELEEDILDGAVLQIARRGIYVTIVAGNERQHANNLSPARVEHENVYTVSAHDKHGNLTDFSNYGTPPVDISASGKNILSLYKDNELVVLSGTSMAAPHIAGLLMRDKGKVCHKGFIKSDVGKIHENIAHTCSKMNK